ncbi:MAG TPA: transposase [Pseudobacteroides sp.]|uniref:transposase n=1 Tax=Pseudobacteroides sp. TaxID=1968840 RepID=UPI002F9386E5
MRKSYNGEFKAKAVIMILREEKSLTQLSSELGVHVNQLAKWKKEAIEALPGVLEDGRRKGDKEIEELQQKIKELYADIGELTTQLNWLKKIWN